MASNCNGFLGTKMDDSKRLFIEAATMARASTSIVSWAHRAAEVGQISPQGIDAIIAASDYLKDQAVALRAQADKQAAWEDSPEGRWSAMASS